MSTKPLSDREKTRLENRDPSVAAMFRKRVAKSPNGEAFRYPDASDKFVSVTWKQLGDRVEKLAAGLIELGVGVEQCVAVISGTRFEWVLADLAANCAGATTTTVYPSTMPADVAYILSNSGSVIAFAEDDEQVAKLNECRAETPELKKVIVFEGTTDGEWTISLDDLERMGADALAQNAELVEQRTAEIKPEMIATLIYTSGTTGTPKGVRLSNDGWCFIAVSIAVSTPLTEDDLQFLWLPLAHAFGKVLLVMQLEIGFATAIDGRVPKIVDNLAAIRPTFMGAAPRIFEKAHGGVISQIEEEGGVKAKLFNWAFKVGVQAARLEADNKPVPKLLDIQRSLADKLVFSKVRERFGGRIRFFISGAAPLSLEIAEWFHAAGLLILQGYGMTETSAASVVDRPYNYKLGTVGIPLPGTEVEIAEDGEIMIRNPAVMYGYHNMPEATEEVLKDGWMATGDIGEIDAEGFLRITDRKKDLFKTSGGKYVAPTHIEGLFKGITPLVSQIMVHGAERKFVSALITLDEDAIKNWAETNGMSGKSYAEVAKSGQMQSTIQAAVDELNGRLNKWEQIKKFEILEADFTVETGEITPSLKMKRKVIEDNNAAVLTGFYD